MQQSIAGVRKKDHYRISVDKEYIFRAFGRATQRIAPSACISQPLPAEVARSFGHFEEGRGFSPLQRPQLLRLMCLYIEGGNMR